MINNLIVINCVITVCTLIAIDEAMEVNVSDLLINKTLIQYWRDLLKERAFILKNKFKENYLQMLILNWDGKFYNSFYN